MSRPLSVPHPSTPARLGDVLAASLTRAQAQGSATPAGTPRALSPSAKQNVKTLEAQAVECDLLADRSQTRQEMESWLEAAAELRETARKIKEGCTR